MNKLVIISGLSGSGKSCALNAFEDLDYYAIDNLPIKLLGKFLDLVSDSEEFEKVALVMDSRDKEFTHQYAEALKEVGKRAPGTEVLFLEADDQSLLKRFSETRRRHPLSKSSVEEGVEKEKKELEGLKDFASTVLDTSNMDVHELKKRIFKQFGAPSANSMQIQFISFGFKHGAPSNCDLQFDVRFLSNPHFVSELKDKTGLDQPVKEYLEKDSRTKDFLERLEGMLEFLIPQYLAEGKRYLTIGIGCTGGKHRSVYMTEALFERLSQHLDEKTPLRREHAHISA